MPTGAKLPRTWLAALGKSNRIYRANIVTSGPRSTSKACLVKKLSIAFLAPTSWFAALAPHGLRGLHVSIAYPAPISWQKRPCSQSHVKHVSVSTAMAFKASDRRHHAVEFIRNPVSSYFHSQVFYFYAIEFTLTAMNRHFRSQVRLSCDSKLTRNRANTVIHFYFGADLISVISVQAFFT